MCQKIENLGSSPCIRGGFITHYHSTKIPRLIPVYTGRIVAFTQLRVRFIGSSPCIRGGSISKLPVMRVEGLIPVYTGRILNFSKISEATKSPIRSQIPVICSVCIIFSKYVFADNAFWSKSGRNNGLSLPYMFRHNKTTGRISFSQIAIPSCASDT